MDRLRAMFFSCAVAALAGCGGGGTNTALPVAAPAATPAPAVVTVLVGTAPATQSLPAASGATATVALAAAAGTPANASVTVTAGATAPAGVIALASAGRQAKAAGRVPLVYFTFVPNVDIQLASFPAFTVAFPAGVLPAGSSIHEGFLDASSQQPLYTLDIAVGANGATFTSSANAPKLLAGKSYVFVFYYETGSSATPSPAPSASPSASPAPTPTPTATASASPSPRPSASPTPAPTANAAFLTPVASVSSTPFQAASSATGVQTVALGPDGKLYYADAGANAVHIDDPAVGASTITLQFNDGGIVRDVGTTSVAKGSDGRLWFTTAQGYVYALGTDRFGQFYKPANVPVLNAITAGPDGNLWAIGNTLVAVTTTAGVQSTFALPVNGNRQQCNAITAGPDGALWYTCKPNIIGRVTTGGAFTEYTTSANRNPNAIVTGSDGNLWFEENANNANDSSIGRITPTGAITEINVAAKGLTGPMGAMVSAPDGTIWVGNNGQAFVLTVTGNSAGTFTNVSFPIQAVPVNTIFSSWVVGPDGKSLWASNFGRGALIIR